VISLCNTVVFSCYRIRVRFREEDTGYSMCVGCYGVSCSPREITHIFWVAECRVFSVAEYACDLARRTQDILSLQGGEDT